jgi:hypothetical protein
LISSASNLDPKLQRLPVVANGECYYSHAARFSEPSILIAEKHFLLSRY